MYDGLFRPKHSAHISVVEAGVLSKLAAICKCLCGVHTDPFQDDATFVLCMLTLEELGGTGAKGLIGLFSNPVLANGISGLATSAAAQAAVEVTLCWG